MALDFRAVQTRTNKIIASGSTGSGAKLLVYPVEAATNLSGGINPSVFNTSSIGTDVFLYVSGGTAKQSGTFGATVFGGDVVVSGSLYATLISSQSSLTIASGSFTFETFTGTLVTITNSQSSETNYSQRFQTTSDATYSFCKFEFAALTSSNVINLDILLIGKTFDVSKRARLSMNVFAYYTGSTLTIDPDSGTVVLPDLKTDSNVDFNAGPIGSGLRLSINGPPATTMEWLGTYKLNFL